MARLRTALISVGAYIVCAISTVTTASPTPQFARETNLPCVSCHVHASLLNDFGQRYFANGFRVGKNSERVDTPPIWGTLGIQASAGQGFGKAVPISYSQTEIASYGYAQRVRLLYHLAFQPTKGQTDIYLLSPVARGLTVQAGEIGLLGQYIPKLDVSPTRPANLSPLGNDLFAPGANAYAVRVVGSLKGGNAMPYANGWMAAATIPFSNETPSALQPEFDETPSGVFAEIWHRQGFTSYGVNTFLGRNDRRYFGATGQHQAGELFFAAGAARASSDDDRSFAASLSCTYVPTYDKAFGLRLDDQDGIMSYVPTASWMIGGQKSVVRITAETRFANGVPPVATLSAQYKF